MLVSCMNVSLGSNKVTLTFVVKLLFILLILQDGKKW